MSHLLVFGIHVIFLTKINSVKKFQKKKQCTRLSLNFGKSPKCVCIFDGGGVRAQLIFRGVHLVQENEMKTHETLFFFTLIIFQYLFFFLFKKKIKVGHLLSPSPLILILFYSKLLET